MPVDGGQKVPNNSKKTTCMDDVSTKIKQQSDLKPKALSGSESKHKETL